MGRDLFVGALGSRLALSAGISLLLGSENHMGSENQGSNPSSHVQCRCQSAALRTLFLSYFHLHLQAHGLVVTGIPNHHAAAPPERAPLSRSEETPGLPSGLLSNLCNLCLRGACLTRWGLLFPTSARVCQDSHYCYQDLYPLGLTERQ